jgi:DNA-binding response OmpR family regulator
MYNLAMKILTVEDDADIREFIQMGLQTEGFVVDAATDGKAGSYMARVNSYDLIILDNSLPHRSGLDVCADIRNAGLNVPIIFLSVIDEVETKVEALRRGADDYLTKPFHFEELRERVRALLRRPAKIQDPVLSVGELSLDTEKRLVTRAGETLYLTRKEFSLLEYLMKHADAPVSRNVIMEHVWSAQSDPFSNTVEAHILNLRKKINAGFERDLIRNIPGRGYIIEA